MMYTKAGECLSYGLGYELLGIKHKKEDKPNYNLKGFVTYFALKGYLSEATVKGIKISLKNLNRKNLLLHVKEKFLYISELLIKDLKKRYVFEDFDQLFDRLNETNIPSWAFESNGALLDLYPHVYLNHELIYYMGKDERNYYFRCVHISRVNVIQEYSRCYPKNFGTDVSDKYINYTISNKYSEILAFNEETQTFYLKPRYTDRLYVEYHADTGQEIICHYRCIGVIGNKFPVIEKDKCVCVGVGNNVNVIKKIDVTEEYLVKNDCIYVYPKIDMPVMFRPYRLLLDGERMEISDDEAIEYVLEKMRVDVGDCVDLFIETENEVGIDNKVVVFSLDYIDKIFLRKYDLQDNREARLYHFIVKLLKNYLSFDSDVLDYFFMFADVSKRMAKENYYWFIGECIYWRLNELHLTGKLSRVVRDANKLKKKLLQDAYWDDETIMTEKSEKCNGEFIGSFSIDKEKITAHTETIDKGICIGDIVITKCQNSRGLVAYNLEKGIYEIQYYRELTKTEIKLVRETFHIVDKAYRVSVDKSRA